MATQATDLKESSSRSQKAAAVEPPFGVNEMRLGPRTWLIVVALVVTCAVAIPAIWKRIERFDTGRDYRIPYTLSTDYWLYQRRLEGISDPAAVPILGDSVVWGQYVRPDGTLTHYLNREVGKPDQFVNCGVNGLFPLALEGLVEYYGGALRNRKIIVHCNLLWMSSPQADLSVKKAKEFNHPRLVPQFFPRIPCYRADASARLSAVFERHIGFFAWVGHLDDVYFDQRSIPAWTLVEDQSDPPQRPNAWRNPLRQITLAVPGEVADDPERGPASPQHKPWTDGGATAAHFDWVDLEASLQWHAFQRVIERLRSRGNDVLVILGPFNEHMVAEDQRPTLAEFQHGISDWLTAQGVPLVIPETLPSDLYADASHPLTEGYALMAKRLSRDATFQNWLGSE